jgi:hypothetical protein
MRIRIRTFPSIYCHNLVFNVPCVMAVERRVPMPPLIRIHYVNVFLHKSIPSPRRNHSNFGVCDVVITEATAADLQVLRTLLLTLMGWIQ